MHIEKRRAFIINFTYFLILAVIALFVLKYAMPLLSPFVVAAIIAFLLRRPIRFVCRKTGLRDKPVALITVALFFCTIGVLMALIAIKLFSSLAQFVGTLPTLYANHLAQPLAAFFDGLDRLFSQFEFLQSDAALISALQELETQLIQAISSLVSGISGAAMSFVSSVATSLPGLLVAVIFTIVASFFITADYEKMVKFCLHQLSEKNRDILIQIKEYVIGTLFVCVRSYLIILFITFIELSLGLSILGVRNVFLVSFCIAVLDILPVVGTGTAMLPWAIVSLVQGKYAFALGLIVVYLAITVIRNIIEPKIVGHQLGLHPVVTLASMFAGGKLFGVIGLFGFPILLSLLRHLNENGIISLFKAVPSEEDKP